LARKQKHSILKHTDYLNRDSIVTDKIFAPLKNENWPIMCGWKNTGREGLKPWQQEENRQMSEQRGINYEIFIKY